MLLGASRSDASLPPFGAQAALWDAGVVAVPVGVLADARLFVVVGSIALLASLVAFGQTYRLLAADPDAALGRLEVRYLALIAFMASSVLAGTVLAWDIPWL
jgi:hypothetical protein